MILSTLRTFISLLPVYTLLWCSPIKSWILRILILAVYYVLSGFVFPNVFSYINFVLWIIGLVCAIIFMPWWFTVIYALLFAYLLYAQIKLRKQNNG